MKCHRSSFWQVGDFRWNFQQAIRQYEWSEPGRAAAAQLYDMRTAFFITRYDSRRREFYSSRRIGNGTRHDRRMAARSSHLHSGTFSDQPPPEQEKIDQGGQRIARKAKHGGAPDLTRKQGLSGL